MTGFVWDVEDQNEPHVMQWVRASEVEEADCHTESCRTRQNIQILF